MGVFLVSAETNNVLIVVYFYICIAESGRFNVWEIKRVSKIYNLLIIVLVEGGFNVVLKLIVKQWVFSNATEHKLTIINKYGSGKGFHGVLDELFNVGRGVQDRTVYFKKSVESYLSSSPSVYGTIRHVVVLTPLHIEKQHM